VSFTVAADAYDRFMGTYSVPLAPLMADFAGVRAGERVLDVGCGPGALTTELAGRLGPACVTAVDPSATFLAAARERHPEADVRCASAEQLPFADGVFDRALAQLVVHFMADPSAGVAEMARVTRRGGLVAACVWDHGGGRGPLSPFWNAARELDPAVHDESERAGARDGELERLLHGAGLREVEGTALAVSVEHASFDRWWGPFTLGVGPAGTYTCGLDAGARARLRERCRELLPPAPFVMSAHAWAARGVV
jgi:SAM-dependent methyltransferase